MRPTSQAEDEVINPASQNSVHDDSEEEEWRDQAVSVFPVTLPLSSKKLIGASHTQRYTSCRKTGDFNLFNDGEYY